MHVCIIIITYIAMYVAIPASGLASCTDLAMVVDISLDNN